MKDFPSKPKYPAIKSATQQALSNSAATTQTCGSLKNKSNPTYSKASKTVTMPDFESLPNSGFVRLPLLLLLLACSRATIWRWVKAGKLPKPKKLSARVTAWNVGELRVALSAYMKGEQS